MKPVAASDDIAPDLMRLASMGVGHTRRIAVEVMYCDFAGLIDRFATRSTPHLHQVTRDLGLAIDGDGLAA